jgi:hypothetical protein
MGTAMMTVRYHEPKVVAKAPPKLNVTEPATTNGTDGDINDTSGVRFCQFDVSFD